MRHGETRLECPSGLKETRAHALEERWKNCLLRQTDAAMQVDFILQNSKIQEQQCISWASGTMRNLIRHHSSTIANFTTKKSYYPHLHWRVNWKNAQLATSILLYARALFVRSTTTDTPVMFFDITNPKTTYLDLHRFGCYNAFRTLSFEHSWYA